MCRASTLRVCLSLFLVSVVLLSCEAVEPKDPFDLPVPLDLRVVDVAVPDSGAPDTGAADTGVVDTGVVDVGVVDATPDTTGPLMDMGGDMPPQKCVLNSDCTDPATPVCDPSGVCVECLVDGDCTDPAKTKCSTAKGCVACLISADCTDPTKPYCSLDNTCVACLASADCVLAADPALQWCDDDFECVACLQNSHCTDPLFGICASDNKCVECVADTDCTDPAATKCSPDNACVACLASTDCVANPALQWCDDDFECVECLKNTHCTNPAFGVCATDNKCVECVADTDCTDPTKTKCDTPTNTCVAPSPFVSSIASGPQLEDIDWFIPPGGGDPEVIVTSSAGALYPASNSWRYNAKTGAKTWEWMAGGFAIEAFEVIDAVGNPTTSYLAGGPKGLFYRLGSNMTISISGAGQYTDLVRVASPTTDGRVLGVQNAYGSVRWVTYDHLSESWSMDTVLVNATQLSSTGKPVSAWGPDDTSPFLTVTDGGYLWHIDWAAKVFTQVGQVGTSPKRIRCAGSLCAATGGGSDLHLIAWPDPLQPPVIKSTETVGNGTIGVDLVEDTTAGVWRVATAGYNDGTFSITTVNLLTYSVYSNVKSTVGSGCTGPSHIAFHSIPKYLAISCNGAIVFATDSTP
jgi:hypothetical protein